MSAQPLSEKRGYGPALLFIITGADEGLLFLLLRSFRTEYIRILDKSAIKNEKDF